MTAFIHFMLTLPATVFSAIAAYLQATELATLLVALAVAAGALILWGAALLARREH